MSFAKRLQKELTECQGVRGLNVNVHVEDDDTWTSLWTWHAVIYGPEGSLYEGRIFKFKVRFPYNYPFQPPKITMLTPLLHVNIHPKQCHICFPDTRVGELCVCSLAGRDWTPAIIPRDLLLAIRDKLKHPNFEDPTDSDLAELYKRSKDEYEWRIREHVSR